MDCDYMHDGTIWVCRACGDRRERPVRRNCDPAYQRALTTLRSSATKVGEAAIQGCISCGKKILSFSESQFTHTKSNLPLLNEKEINARIDLCQKCDKYNGKRCTECGCAVNRKRSRFNKAALPLEECPLGKWTKHDN